MGMAVQRTTNREPCVEIFGESHHATTQRCTNTNCTVHVSCLYILHLLRCHSFDFWVLSLHGSIISNRLWAKLTSLCCILCLSVLPLCHSESSESSGVISVLFAPTCILGREPFVPIWVSNRIYLCLLRWSALRVYLCIVSLICGACRAYAPCSARISVSAVLDLVISTQAHPLFCWWEDHQTLHWLIFILSPSPPPLATLI